MFKCILADNIRLENDIENLRVNGNNVKKNNIFRYTM